MATLKQRVEAGKAGERRAHKDARFYRTRKKRRKRFRRQRYGTWTRKVRNSKKWDLYVLEGEKGLYVGISQNVEARIESHRKGKCKTSARLGDPKKLRPIYVVRLGSLERAEALEAKMHKLTDRQIRRLISSGED